MRLLMPSADSWTASVSVGCACMVEMISSAVASSVMASPISAIISVTPSPTMWQPRISSCLEPTMSLTKPWVSPSAWALPEAMNGKVEVLYSMLFSLQ